MNESLLIQNINEFIELHQLLPDNSTVIVGLSGGPDSVFLLYILKRYEQSKKLKLVAAHLDHEWRKDSYKDVMFCEKLCKNLDITFEHEKASNLPDQLKSGSQEEIGRKLRRYYFQQLAQEYDAQRIALGHHAQDQQETFFIRLIRGTTLAGLSGIKPKDGLYIRPLLQINKKDILAYLEKHAIAYLVDPSNVSESFLRNRIRKHVLPALEQCDERFDVNFLKTIEHLQQADSFVAGLTHKVFDAIARFENDKWLVSLTQLQDTHPFLQDRLLIHWLIAAHVPFLPSASLLAEIKRFLFTSSAKQHTLYGQWRIVRQNNIVWIETIL